MNSLLHHHLSMGETYYSCVCDAMYYQRQSYDGQYFKASGGFKISIDKAFEGSMLNMLFLLKDVTTDENAWIVWDRKPLFDLKLTIRRSSTGGIKGLKRMESKKHIQEQFTSKHQVFNSESLFKFGYVVEAQDGSFIGSIACSNAFYFAKERNYPILADSPITVEYVRPMVLSQRYAQYVSGITENTSTLPKQKENGSNGAAANNNNNNTNNATAVPPTSPTNANGTNNTNAPTPQQLLPLPNSTSSPSPPLSSTGSVVGSILSTPTSANTSSPVATSPVPTAASTTIPVAAPTNVLASIAAMKSASTTHHEIESMITHILESSGECPMVDTINTFSPQYCSNSIL